MFFTYPFSPLGIILKHGLSTTVQRKEEAMKKLKLQKLMCCDCFCIFDTPRLGQGRQRERCDECHEKRRLQRQRAQDAKRKAARRAVKVVDAETIMGRSDSTFYF
tara:strand:- start:105 stop:419 length:315 start_codon:yes stop_codon:yes gene_type:complete